MVGALESESNRIEKNEEEEEEIEIDIDKKEEWILKKQKSMLSLTIEEIECKSGRSLGSMNLEDFIANIWSVEEFGTAPMLSLETNIDNINHNASAFSIPIPLCNRTVDQIWSELHKDDESTTPPPPLTLRQQQTLGQMTLEDFLAKAGVVHDDRAAKIIGLGPCQVYGHDQSSIVARDDVDEMGKNKKKRIIDGPPELVVERRHRRMIKNRESAARSRARKQAYTVELEVELNQLKEENEKLKQVMAEAKLKRKQEILRRTQQYSTKAQKLVEKLRTIRRAESLGW